MPCLKNCPKFVPCLTNPKKCQTDTACNGGVLTPPPAKVTLSNHSPPSSPKILNPPYPQTFYSPLQLEMAASTFSNKYMFIFLKLL